MSIKADFSQWIFFEIDQPFESIHSINDKGDDLEDAIDNKLRVVKNNEGEYYVSVQTIIEGFVEEFRAKMTVTARILVRGNWATEFPLSEDDLLEVKKIVFKANHIAVVQFNQEWAASNLPSHSVKNLSVGSIESRLREEPIEFQS